MSNGQEENIIHEDNALRPSYLTEFTGQKALLDDLMVYLRSAKRRRDVLDHVLFYGPPGLGKTTLSKIIASELEVPFVNLNAAAIQKPGDLAGVLVGLEPRAVLFIDEVHRLPPSVEETLYTAVEGFKVTVAIGGMDASPIEIGINPFTLVAATTRKGMLTQPMQDRFGIEFRLEYYEPEELAQIIVNVGDKLGEHVPEDAALSLGQRSRGTPRIAIKYFKRLRDFKMDFGAEYTPEFVSEIMERLGIDEIGMTTLDRRYIEVMDTQFNGGPVGADTLATALSESRDTIETSIEPYLIRQGILAKTRQGRVLTDEYKLNQQAMRL